MCFLKTATHCDFDTPHAMGCLPRRQAKACWPTIYLGAVIYRELRCVEANTTDAS
jgi:hypothetical protein